MKIERVLKQGEERLSFLREMMHANVQAVIHYLSESEKYELGLHERLPELDFTRAVAAKVTISGEERVRVFRRFVGGYVTIQLPGLEGSKTVKLIASEKMLSATRSEFVIIFVHQVFGGPLSRYNISYLIDIEIDAWEESLTSYLRHHMGGVTVIR